ncbi:MAG TPA: hypothetical protein VKR06_43245 [Ktedonosporobacter sp.]|nr:hypothetical protein [Ktedonosporobacter sp.]
MAHQHKRTTLYGALIFVTLVAIAGLGFSATGRFSNPFGFLQAFQELQHYNQQVATAPRQVGSHIHNSGSGTPASHGSANHSHGGGRAGDRIAWPLLGAVLFDIWVLFAVTACYILVQQTLGFLIHRFRSRRPPEILA